MTRCVLICAISALFLRVDSRSILDVPWEARKANILRVTRQSCDDCVTLEDFYKDNTLVFLLFYERNLVSHHNYKGAIVAGFHEVCKDLRWSKVVCGIVDMVEDKVYAEKYIDPKTAPAHIAVADGEPIPSKKEWIEKLMSKPGDKAMMMWHLRQQMVKDELGDPLQISMDIQGKEQLSRFTSKHEVVIVAHLAADGGTSRATLDSFRAAAQQLVLRKEVPGILAGASAGGTGKKAERQRRQLRQRLRVLFVALTRDGAAPAGLQRGQLAAFVGGQLQSQRSSLPKQLDAQHTSEIVNALKVVAEPVIATAQAKLSPQTEKTSEL